MRNTSLKQLELASNKFSANGMRKWSEVLGKTSLTYLDLSSNSLDDEGTKHLVRGLSFAPEGLKDPLMTFLILK